MTSTYLCSGGQHKIFMFAFAGPSAAVPQAVPHGLSSKIYTPKMNDHEDHADGSPHRWRFFLPKNLRFFSDSRRSICLLL